MMKRNRNTIIKSPFFWISLFLLMIGFIYINDYYVRKNIILYSKITIGKVIAFPQGGKSRSMGIEYRTPITYNQFILPQSFVYDEFKKTTVKQLFIGKCFPVIYDSTNPSNSHILIAPEDFIKWGVRFPDSLDWVRPYFTK